MEDKGRKPGGACPRDISAKWWRQVGYWGLTLNASLGFPVLILALWFSSDDTDWSIMTAIYPTILAAWCAAAGIRQWGKNKGSEVENPGPLE